MRFRLSSIAALAIAVAALGPTHDVTTNSSAAAGSVRSQGGAGRPDVIIVLTDQQRADATFGPVVGLMAVKDDDEASVLMNDSRASRHRSGRATSRPPSGSATASRPARGS